jgi:hypothetical protein
MGAFRLHHFKMKDEDSCAILLVTLKGEEFRETFTTLCAIKHG